MANIDRTVSSSFTLSGAAVTLRVTAAHSTLSFRSGGNIIRNAIIQLNGSTLNLTSHATCSFRNRLINSNYGLSRTLMTARCVFGRTVFSGLNFQDFASIPFVSEEHTLSFTGVATCQL